MTLVRAAQRRVGPSGQRLGYGVIDQATTAALSFVVVTGSARVLLPVDFGAFALLNGTYVLLFTVEQALVSEVSIIAHEARGSDGHRHLLTSAWQGLWLSLTLGALATPIGFWITGSLSVAAAFGAVCFMGLYTDTVRGVLIASGRASHTATLSTGSLALALVAFTIGLTPHVDLLLVVLAWGVAFLPAWLYVVFIVMTRFGAVADSRATLRDRSVVRNRIRGTLLVEAIVGGGAQFVALLAVDSLVSREEAGALRLAISLVGPISVLFNVVRLYGVAELRRSRTVHAQMKMACAIGVACCALAAVGLALLLLVPVARAQEILGPSWKSARDLLGWAALERATVGAGLGFGVVLRARHVLADPMRLRVVTSPLAVAAGYAGTALGGAAGALAGVSVTELLQAVGLAWILRREL